MIATVGRNAAIQGLRDYRKELADSINKLQQDLRVVDQSILLLSGSTVGPGCTETPSRQVNQDAGPQEIVEDFLRGSPGRFYRPRELAREIQRSGYQVKTKKPEIWFAQVTNCLRRAERKGIAETREIEGKKSYGLKQKIETGESKDGRESISS